MGAGGAGFGDDDGFAGRGMGTYGSTNWLWLRGRRLIISGIGFVPLGLVFVFGIGFVWKFCVFVSKLLERQELCEAPLVLAGQARFVADEQRE